MLPGDPNRACERAGQLGLALRSAQHGIDERGARLVRHATRPREPGLADLDLSWRPGEVQVSETWFPWSSRMANEPGAPLVDAVLGRAQSQSELPSTLAGPIGITR